jgi:hypothetical protein
MKHNGWIIKKCSIMSLTEDDSFKILTDYIQLAVFLGCCSVITKVVFCLRQNKSDLNEIFVFTTIWLFTVVKTHLLYITIFELKKTTEMKKNTSVTFHVLFVLMYFCSFWNFPHRILIFNVKHSWWDHNLPCQTFLMGS